MAQSIDAVDGEEDLGEKKKARDREITLYLNAADIQFISYVNKLSAQRNGTNLALDIAAGATAAVGSVVTGASTELIAGTGFLVGAKSSINKEVYFQQTLPAIVASMQTNRLRVLTSIKDHMKLSVQDYPLSSAFSELKTYELAGSINFAIAELTTAASKALVESRQEYTNAIEGCDADPALDDKQRQVRDALADIYEGTRSAPFADTIDPAVTRLAATMAALKIEPSAKATTPDAVESQITALQDFRNRHCAAGTLTTILSTLIGEAQ